MDLLTRIKRLIMQDRYRMTRKAHEELEADGLDESDAKEAIINAPCIKKILKSRSPFRGGRSEKLYVIEGQNYEGTLIYTKGKISHEGPDEVLYIYVSAKRSTDRD